jgi:hypothetical protein
MNRTIDDNHVLQYRQSLRDNTANDSQYVSRSYASQSRTNSNRMFHNREHRVNQLSFIVKLHINSSEVNQQSIDYH